MNDMTTHRTRAGHAVAVADDNLLLFAVAGIGFSVSFQTIAHLAKAHGLPGYPVLYPIGIDVGILALVREARRLMKLRRSDAVPRALAWVLTAFTIYVNVHGSPPHDWLGRALHVVMPGLWVVFLELSRRRLRATEVTTRDGVPLARWLLAPASTFMMWRRMVLWQITSYRTALDREQLRRRTIARLRARHGDRWRSLADSSVVWQLVHGIDVEEAAAELDAAAARRRTAALAEVQSVKPAVNKRRGSGRKPARSSGRARPSGSAVNNSVVPADVDTQAEALRILADEPGISGGELGRRLGVSESYGCRLKRDLTRSAAPA